MHETSLLTEGKPTCGKYLWQGFGMPIHLLKPFAKRMGSQRSEVGKDDLPVIKAVPSLTRSFLICAYTPRFRNPGIRGSAELRQQTVPLATVIDLRLISYSCRS